MRDDFAPGRSAPHVEPAVDLPVDLIVAWARAMHQAGMTSDELEDAVRVFGGHLRLKVQTNALPTSLTLAIGPMERQRVVIQRLEPGRLNLRRLAQLTLVERRLHGGAIGVGTALDEVHAIDAAVPPDAPWLTVGAYALLSTGAALLLGGGQGEITVSAIIGIVLGGIAALGARLPRIDRLFEVLAAFVATIVVTLYERFAGPIALYVAVVAGIVQLLPGFSLTTALNELANRHLVAGTARLGGVLITLLSLASGFALALGATGSAVLYGATIGTGRSGFSAAILAALLMGLAIAVLLHARPRDLGWILAATMGTIALSRVLTVGGLTGVAPFVTAVIVGVATSLAGRLARIPAPIVQVPALLVLVPGSLSYEGLLYVFQADATDALTLGIRAIVAAILIVSGFFFSQLLVPPEVHPGDPAPAADAGAAGR